MPFDQYGRDLAREKKALILAVILFFNLILISTRIVLKNQQPLLVFVASRIVSPFQVAFQKTSEFISRNFQRYVFLKGIYQKYQTEKKKNWLLRHENFQLKSLLREYVVQKKAKQQFQNFLLVHVVSVDTNFPFNTVVIDRGKRGGIHENMPVVNLEGELFGKTIEPISNSTSTVRLITSPIGGAGAYLEKNMFEGFLSGNNNAVCNFKYLLGNKPVQVGDRVVTSGNDMIFPPFIPIGVVVEIKKEDISQQVSVRPYFLDKPIKDLVVLLQ